jgi:hypothetical protein
VEAPFPACSLGTSAASARPTEQPLYLADGQLNPGSADFPVRIPSSPNLNCRNRYPAHKATLAGNPRRTENKHKQLIYLNNKKIRDVRYGCRWRQNESCPFY